MDLSSLQSIFDGFDLAAFLPELDTFMGWIELFLRLAVMAGPFLLLGFGLLYLLAPPKEANHRAGYRFYWGMSSLEAWQFTQRLAGMAWSGLGIILTVVMAIICNGFRGMDPMDMAWLAGKCIAWELGLTVFSTVAIDAVVIVFFDRYGYRREFTLKKQ